MDLKISDKPFQLAKEWMKSMSGGENLDGEGTEESELRVEERPARLGLGAQGAHYAVLATTLNPLEKKLKAKLGISKAPYGQETKPSRSYLNTHQSVSTKEREPDMNDDEDDTSRASQFNRKRSSSTLILHSENSKHRRKKNNVG